MPRILIVDDEKLKTSLYKEIVREFDVVAANSYEDAEFYLPQKFDHILCDEDLKDGSGHKFIQEYSSIHPETDIFWYSASPQKPSANGYKCHDFSKVEAKLDSLKSRYIKPDTKVIAKSAIVEEALLEIRDIKETVSDHGKQLSDIRDITKTVCEHSEILSEHKQSLEKLNAAADKNVIYVKYLFRYGGGIVVAVILYFSWLITYLDSAQTKSFDNLQKTITAHIYAAPKN